METQTKARTTNDRQQCETVTVYDGLNFLVYTLRFTFIAMIAASLYQGSYYPLIVLIPFLFMVWKYTNEPYTYTTGNGDEATRDG